MEISVKLNDSVRNHPQFQAAKQIIAVLENAGFPAYLVGGAPRDILLGRAPHDFDIATAAHPEQIQTLFERTIPLGASFGVVTVLIDSVPFEVATFREERDYMDGRHPETVCYTLDPVRDVQRRDFTINAFLLDPVREVLLDYVDGFRDLKRGIIRTVGDPVQRFSEDYLRMLRAVRFASRYRYSLDSATADAIRKMADSVAGVSAERIFSELNEMLLCPDPEGAFRMLSDTGLLGVVLPEVERLHGVEQPPKFHPEGDVFEHTMLMLHHMAVRREKTAWSVLLHDIGKPDTQTFADDGTPHFYGHETLGADLALAVLQRLKTSKKLQDSVYSAVQNHMRFAHIDKMKPSKWRMIMADENFPVELELHRIDCLSSNFLMGNYLLSLDRRIKLAAEPPLPAPLLTGKDLKRLGFEPSPVYGKILSDLQERQLEGELKDRTEALEYVRTHYPL